MEMYAVTFWLLIEYSLKLDGENYRVLANISALPHLSSQSAGNVINSLQHYGEPPVIITPAKVKEDRKRLRELMTSNSFL